MTTVTWAYLPVDEALYPLFGDKQIFVTGLFCKLKSDDDFRNEECDVVVFSRRVLR